MLLNDVVGTIKVIYTSVTNGGAILYRESPVSNISFGDAATLMGGPAANFNFATSTHQTYHPDVAIVATNQASPRQLVSVLATDASAGDVTPPVVSSIVRSSPTAQNTTTTTVAFAVNFSESVNGVNAADFTLATGGTAAGNISDVSGSGAAYIVTVNSITGTGSLRLDLNGSGTGIEDGAGNTIAGGFTSGQIYNVSPGDASSPSVSSILRSSPTTQNTTATTVVFAVNFSEAVNGVDASDFTLTNGGTANGTITTVLGACANYTVTVTSLSGNGTLRLDLRNSGTGIVDAVGNPVTGGFSTGEYYIIDAPQVAVSPKTKNISIPRSETLSKSIEATVFPNPTSNDVTFRFTLPQTGKYSIRLYNSSGVMISQLEEGTAQAAVVKNVKIGGSRLTARLYTVSIQTATETKIIKLVKE